MVEMKKSLYRLPKQGKITGVCAGLAEYFDIDVTIVRVIFVVMAFATGGAVILLYIILSIVLPVPGVTKGTIDEKVERLGQDLVDSKVVSRTRNYTGAALIILGAWLLLCQFFPQLFDFRWDYIWPILLMFFGFMIIIRRSHD